MFDPQIAVALFAAFLFGYGRGPWDGDHCEACAALNFLFFDYRAR